VTTDGESASLSPPDESQFRNTLQQLLRVSKESLDERERLRPRRKKRSGQGRPDLGAPDVGTAP
jgi:hypothetical protein